MQLAFTDNIVNTKKSQRMQTVYTAKFSALFAAGINNRCSRYDILCFTVKHKPQ